MALARTVVSARLSGSVPAVLGVRTAIAALSSSSSSSSRTFSSSSSSRQNDAERSGMAPGMMPGEAPVALPTRMKPVSPNFYTTMPTYADKVYELQELARRIKRMLTLNHIPTTSKATAARADVERARFKWQKQPEMERKFRTQLALRHYRDLTSNANGLAKYIFYVREYMAKGECGEAGISLAREAEKSLAELELQAERSVKQVHVHHAIFLSSSSGMDDKGRAYARGRRKTAHARVWIAPASNPELLPLMEAGREGAASNAAEQGRMHETISTSILINNRPFNDIVTRDSDRELITFPLRAVGMVGAFNVFALVKGGGTTGRTGAVQHGLARALVTYFDAKARAIEDTEGISSPLALPLRKQAEDIRALLLAISVLNRDPRMAERKKTGRPKARKSFAWVKR